jgi:hypothetical protein
MDSSNHLQGPADELPKRQIHCQTKVDSILSYKFANQKILKACNIKRKMLTSASRALFKPKKVTSG